MTPSRTQAVFTTLLCVCAAVLLSDLYYIFMAAPNERTMGAVQRIFYFHVGSAIACYCAIAAVFAAGVYYLVKRGRKADVWLEAAGEVGFVFCTIVLASGMIWGRAAWNTFFRWEPRVASFLLLWFIFLAFTLLRRFGDPNRIAAHAAVLGIVGALMVPIMIGSVKLLSAAQQLHPQVIERHELADPRFATALTLGIVGMVLLQAVLIWLRARIGFLERHLRQ